MNLTDPCADSIPYCKSTTPVSEDFILSRLVLTLLPVATDVGFFGNKYPEIYSPGCNNGTVNSFTAFSPATLTGGVYGSDEIQSKPLCFGTTFVSLSLFRHQTKVSDIALSQIKYQSGSFLGLSMSQISALTTVLDKANAAMGGCPAANFNDATLKKCPGYSVRTMPAIMTCLLISFRTTVDHLDPLLLAPFSPRHYAKVMVTAV